MLIHVNPGPAGESKLSIVIGLSLLAFGKRPSRKAAV